MLFMLWLHLLPTPCLVIATQPAFVLAVLECLPLLAQAYNLASLSPLLGPFGVLAFSCSPLLEPSD